ncbi:MAG: POTRA domain-containing protein, partial [Fibrobacterota bacterium]
MVFKQSFSLVLLSVLVCGLHASEVSGRAEEARIKAVEIYGNRTTHPEVLDQFFTFDSGAVLDTAQLRITRNNLLRTQLYNSVNIFHRLREDGAYVYVVLEEAVRLSLYYGGEHYSYKYGSKDFWWRVRVSASLNNFRGRLEEFTTSLSFWDHRSLGFAWYKPLLPGPYYVSAGVHIAGFPDDALPMDYLDLA